MRDDVTTLIFYKWAWKVYKNHKFFRVLCTVIVCTCVKEVNSEGVWNVEYFVMFVSSDNL